MEAQGLLGMFQQEMARSKTVAGERANQMVNQFMHTLNPPKEFTEKFRAAALDYMKALQPPWSAEDIVEVWAKVYGSKFSDEELDGLLVWYTSPLGKKDTAASQSALPDFEAHFKRLSDPILQRETQKFFERMKQLAAECNCRR